MGADAKWVVVYEIPKVEEGYYYGVTSEDAMQCLLDNGPFGAKPLYAYLEDSPDIRFSWPWGR